MVLHTAGYEPDPDPESLARRLRDAGVEVVVDVRELPRSRRRGFSKSRLSEVLEAAGIGYEHWRALGTPKPVRDLWKGGDREAGERKYRTHLSHQGRELDALAERLKSERCCLLCMEADPADCHRSIVAEELADRLSGLRVEHL